MPAQQVQPEIENEADEFNFDYSHHLGDETETELKSLVVAIRADRKLAADAIVRIGDNLIRAKELVKHGEWEPWLEAEFGWSQHTACRFVNVAEFVKSSTVLDLEPFDISALYLLASPSMPLPVKEAAKVVALDGHRVTKKGTQQAKVTVAAMPKASPAAQIEAAITDFKQASPKANDPSQLKGNPCQAVIDAFATARLTKSDANRLARYDEAIQKRLLRQAQAALKDSNDSNNRNDYILKFTKAAWLTADNDKKKKATKEAKPPIAAVVPPVIEDTPSIDIPSLLPAIDNIVNPELDDLIRALGTITSLQPMIQSGSLFTTLSIHDLTRLIEQMLAVANILTTVYSPPETALSEQPLPN